MILYFNHGTSKSKGVLTCIPKNCNIKIEKKISDGEGRILFLQCNINNLNYTIGNIYMPTSNHCNEQLKILEKISEMLENLQNDNIILGGDFNIHIDAELDKGNLLGTNKNNEFKKKLINFLILI